MFEVSCSHLLILVHVVSLSILLASVNRVTQRLVDNYRVVPLERSTIRKRITGHVNYLIFASFHEAVWCVDALPFIDRCL